MLCWNQNYWSQKHRKEGDTHQMLCDAAGTGQPGAE